MGSHPRVSASAVLAVTLALAAVTIASRPAGAQTVTAGAIEGIATDSAGAPIPGAEVTLTHHATGWVRVLTTDANGAYRSRALPPGRYDVRVEQLGYRPLLVLDVTVSPAAAAAVVVHLTSAEPPVTRVDTVAYVEGALHAAVARGSWNPGGDLTDLADPQGRLGSLATLAALSVSGLAVQGLPDRMATVGLDGIPRVVATNPDASSADLSTMGMPYLSLDHAEVASGTDVEWSGFGGGLLSAFSVRAPRNNQVRAYSDVRGGSLRGGLVLGGPLVRDTAWALIGVDAHRLETPYPSPWPNDSVANLVVAVAKDSLNTNLSRYREPLTQRTDLVTVFGRFDWQVADGQTLALRAAVADRTSTDLALGIDRPFSLAAGLDARDISASARLDSRLAASMTAQLSFAVDRSLRDYKAPSLPGTVIVSDGLVAGSDGALPGRFERDATRASAALLYRVGPHELKAGFAAAWTSHDISFDPWRKGLYLFGDPGDLAQGRGAFVQTVGGLPEAAFSITSAGGFAQDAWTPISGLKLMYGVRIEGERWPRTGGTSDAEWLRLTGLSSQAVPRLKTQVTPRFGFTWAAGPQREWLFRGDAGVFAEGVDPSLLAEVLSHAGSAQVRRGVGTLGAWPGVPDSTVARITGPVLTLLNQGFQAPRTDRAGLSLAREIDRGTSFEIGGVYRHTDFIPRRSDLNLAPGSQVTDQFGRPIYGTLQQLGGMLVATPGSNRRFTSYDRVWAVDPSGYSDYWGVTVAFERLRERGLSVWASYTYSRTTDNVPGLAGSLPDAQLSPFATAAGTSDWRDGRSDLDVPHRAVVGTQLALGTVRVSALVRYHSGMPFTPGFRDGVDANGDGSGSNDPAFVSDADSGAAAVIGRWACLRQQIGRFAARNSCRGPSAASLDARVALRLFNLGSTPVEIIVDGVNLVTTNEGVVDRALYLVDPSRTLSTGAAGTVVTVPLIANPHFGKLLYRHSPGLGVRFGMRVGL
jgi:hypothetical protein